MRLKSKPSEFKKSVSRARSSRIINMLICTLGLAAAAVAAWGFRDSDYRYFMFSSVAIAGIVLLVLGIKSAQEFAAAKRISQNAVYAVRLSMLQRAFVEKYMTRRGQMIYFVVLLLCLVPQAVALIAMSFIFDSTSYLLYLAGYALVCLALTLIASLYLAARLAAQSLIIAISKDGAIVGTEVIPFRAKKHDTLQLFKFSNYYCLKFFRTGLLGIKFISDLVFPTDGMLRKGMQGPADEQIALALGIDYLFATDVPFFESRDYLSGMNESGNPKESDQIPPLPGNAPLPLGGSPAPVDHTPLSPDFLPSENAPLSSGSVQPPSGNVPENAFIDGRQAPAPPKKMKKKKKETGNAAAPPADSNVYRELSAAPQE